MQPEQEMLIFDDSRAFRRQALWLALAAGVIVFVLWNIPQLDFVLYPFRLFVTFIHEAGHSVAAVFSGGRVIGFEVFNNGTGLATTAGGARWLIIPAGYLGAAFFGAMMFYLANTLRYPRKISLALGTLIIIVALFLQAQNIALVIGVIFGLVLIYLGLKGGIALNVLVLDVLAILVGLNAVLDLLWLVNNTQAALGDVPNDAAAFTREIIPLVPPAIWALVWALLAITMLGMAAWYSVGRHLREELA